MSGRRRVLTDTGLGRVCCVRVAGAAAHRVGYPPTAWEWTPWEYATDGRFGGRWDDPAGVWRTLYVGASRLACYLEVLAFARPSIDVDLDMDAIVVDEEDQAEFPTLAPGLLPRSWPASRVSASGMIGGWFVVPGDPETIATLRIGFRGAAIRHGLADLDGAAIRDGRPRELTQGISQWINTLVDPAGTPVAGIQFDSRHGDGLTLWAVYERPGDHAASGHITPLEAGPIEPDDPELAEAMRLLGLVWSDD
ncbi:RES domain-containing protein [Rhodococcus kronopolitis]|uniref:RES domain-containing protein n=1 Tax=Rhodococcus kronopolitis TaxID=1460226 RepID=A0ABV9FVS2_9NOCA